MFQIHAGNSLVTSNDFKEYELIKEKKSKLSANERKKIVYRVEKVFMEQSQTNKGGG